MSSHPLRRRIVGRGEIRYLKDVEAEALLARPKSIGATVEWKPANAQNLRMSVAVENALGENLALTGRISATYPGRSGWCLVWGQKAASEHPEAIRRLDLRDTHRNPDGEWWRRKTHKHRWSEADNNSWAYTPTDIPHEIPGSNVTEDNYREIFEAFAAECGITLGDGYRWTDPNVRSVIANPGIWEIA